MVKQERFKKLLDFVYRAHQENNISGQEYRQDGKVPFIVHPIWCAVMLLNDTRIPFKQREVGFEALLLHDVLEDTNLGIPEWIESKVRKLVEEMTFKSFEQEVRELKNKSTFIKLLKLVDKLGTMYEEGIGGSSKRRAGWKELTAKLLKDVEKEYGDIRVVQVGKSILDSTNW